MPISVPQRSPYQPMVLAQFPLAKYSYAETSSDQHGPINWTHVQSNDLIIIFEKDSMPVSTVNSFQQRLRLRVVRAREQLEDLNLNDLAREATEQAIARQTRNTKPLVAILVKDPCLAIRYPSDKDQMHRFQLKFCSSRDYRGALDIFIELNCPFSETSRDHIHRSTSVRPDSSSSRITNLTIPPFPGGIDSGQPHSTSAGIRSWNQVLGRSHTALGASTDKLVVNASSPNSFVSDLHSRSATTLSVLGESQKDALGSRTYMQMAGTQNSELGRPTTAPTTTPNFDSQTLDQVLPPRRDLPFSKPGPRLSHTSNKQPMGSPTRLGVSSEQNLNTEDGLNVFPGLKPASSRPHTALSRVTIPTTSSPARQLHLELEDNRRSSPNKEQGQPPRGLIPASSPLLRTSPFAASRPDIGNTGLHYKAPTQSPRAQSVISHAMHEKSPVPQQQYLSVNHDNNGNNPSSTSPTAPYTSPITPADLTAYFTTPESERSQFVNNWICQQLEDDGFRALCQDVERVWQRIAFGTRPL